VPALGAALIVSPTTAMLVIGYYAAMQLLENHFLVPAIMRRQTEIPPVLLLFALLAGGSIGGVLGALVSIPLAGALRVLILELVAPGVRRWTGAASSVRDQHEPP
jgi:predicted PurR-regulated permease PerM